MNIDVNPTRLKAAAAYNAAADHYEEEPLSFWKRHGRRTVELLRVCPGENVLDVGCGTGASALPAAVMAGPHGRVIGVDVAANMLACARSKAREWNLENLSFELTDMTATGFADRSFDVVISVFSVFFVSEMERQVSELWRLLRPGGRLAVTVWAEDAFEPAAMLFAEELYRIRPDITLPKRPWERLTKPGNLYRLFLDAGAYDPVVTTLPDRQRITDPEQFWTIAMGSGFRWEIDQLTPAEQSDLRSSLIARLDEMNIRALETSAHCAVATKPR